MATFIDAKTQEVLHSNVSEPDDHMFHIGNKIEITDTDEKTVSEYLITDIKLPYTFSRGFFGGLSDVGQHAKIFLELVSTQKAR
jgi:hypothetical protein